MSATPPPGLIEARLDTQLALLTEGIRDALARAATSEDDPSILLHTRTSEFANAVNLAKTSGKLVLALAKLNGRFNHDINVRRVGGETPPPEA